MGDGGEVGVGYVLYVVYYYVGYVVEYCVVFVVVGM